MENIMTNHDLPWPLRQFLLYSNPPPNSLMQLGGTVDTIEFNALIELAKMASYFEGPIVEIGTLFGFSTQALALGKRPDQMLLTVDAFVWNPIGIPQWRHYEMTRKNLEFLIRTQNVHLIPLSNENFYSAYTGEAPAMVFIDADHSYEAVSKDIQWAKQVGSKIICGDDFCWEGVRQAVKENFGTQFELRGDAWVYFKE